MSIKYQLVNNDYVMIKYFKLWQKVVLFFIYLALVFVFCIWVGTVIQKSLL